MIYFIILTIIINVNFSAPMEIPDYCKGIKAIINYWYENLLMSPMVLQNIVDPT